MGHKFGWGTARRQSRGGCGGVSRRHDSRTTATATRLTCDASQSQRSTLAVRFRRAVRVVRGGGHGGGALSWLGANDAHPRFRSSDAVSRLRDSALERLGGTSGDATTSLGVASAHLRLAIGSVTNLGGSEITRLGESALTRLGGSALTQLGGSGGAHTSLGVACAHW